MSKFTLKINRKAFGDATVRSTKARELVAEKTEHVASQVRSMTRDEIVTSPEEGKIRARGYVTRLGSGLRGEADDGALTKGLG